MQKQATEKLSLLLALLNVLATIAMKPVLFVNFFN